MSFNTYNLKGSNKMNKKFKISLMHKISIFSLLLVLITAFTMQFFAFQTAQKAIKVTIGENALNITRSVVNTIDIEQFNALQTTDDMNSDYYIQLRNNLNTLREAMGLKYLYTMRKATNGDYIYVVDGTPIDDTESSLIGNVDNEISEDMKLSFEGIEGYELSHSDDWGDLISAFIPIRNASGETVGMLGADFSAKTMVEQLNHAQTNMLITAGVIALFGVILAIIFSVLIIRALKELQNKIKLARLGDLTIKIDHKSNDEVGNISEDFQDMITNMAKIINNIRVNTKNTFQYVSQLNTSIYDTTKATEEITEQVSEIANGANIQVDRVNDVSASMEKVFEEIQTINENVDLVVLDSNEAMEDTKEAKSKLKDSMNQINLVNNTVESTAEIMRQLDNRFQEILKFSESISSIASKTNLLSLNASIEAMSAGEAGKGFAVVAGEIKKLAIQSSEASKQINTLINSMQSEITNSGLAIQKGVVQVREGMNEITDVDKFLEKLYHSNQKVDDRVKLVAKAINHIENDSKSALATTMQLAVISKESNAKTQQSAAAAEEQLAIMEDIKNNINSVKDIVESLDLAVNKFKID